MEKLVQLIEQVKSRCLKDGRIADREWKIIMEVVEKNPRYRSDIIQWVFESLPGYNATRVMAGHEVLHENPEIAWSIIMRLSASANEDDRQTMVDLLGEIEDPRIPATLRPLLNDPLPWIQLEVAERLKSHYPSEIREVVQQLTSHEYQYIREEAVRFLSEMQA